MEKVINENLNNIKYTDLFPQHRQDFWEIIIAQEGEGLVFIQSEYYHITKGDIIILKPFENHYFVQDISKEGARYRHSDIYITIPKMKTVCAVLSVNLYNDLISKKNIIYTVLPDTLLSCLLQSCESYYAYLAANNPVFDIMHKSVISYILGIIVDSSHYAVNDYPPEFQKILSALNEPGMLEKKISDIVPSLNYSHGHLSRLFKRYMNKTIAEYLTGQKIKYSLNYLSNYDMSVLEAGIRAGYDSPSNYIIQFKKMFGMSPSMWRKTNLIKIT